MFNGYHRTYRRSAQTHVRRRARRVIALALAAAAAAAVPASGAGSASPAIVGVAVHPDWTGTAWERHDDLMLALSEERLRFARGGNPALATTRAWARKCRDRGIAVLLAADVALVSNDGREAERVAAFRAGLAQVLADGVTVLGIEGINEPDLEIPKRAAEGKVLLRPGEDWLGYAVRHTKTLSPLAHEAGLPMVAPTIGHPFDHPEVADRASWAGYVDIANAHPYPYITAPLTWEASGGPRRHFDYARRAAGVERVWATETGYFSDSGLTNAQVAAWAPDLLSVLDRAGFERVAWYTLIDRTSKFWVWYTLTDRKGLFSVSSTGVFTVKPQGLAVRDWILAH